MKKKANSFKNVEPNDAFAPSVGFRMGLAAFMSRKHGSDAHLCKCPLACDALAWSLQPKCESTIDFLENCKLKTVKRNKVKKTNDDNNDMVLLLLHDTEAIDLAKR